MPERAIGTDGTVSGSRSWPRRALLCLKGYLTKGAKRPGGRQKKKALGRVCARDGTDHNNYLLGIRKNLLLLNASACHTEDGFDVGYACYICTHRSRIEDLYSGKLSADRIGAFCFPATCIKNDFIFRESVYRHSGFASSEANKQHFACQQNT